MQIIVRQKGSEPERRRKEGIKEILRHYYNREIKHGAAFKSKAGSKSVIKRLYEE